MTTNQKKYKRVLTLPLSEGDAFLLENLKKMTKQKTATETIRYICRSYPELVEKDIKLSSVQSQLEVLKQGMGIVRQALKQLNVI